MRKECEEPLKAGQPALIVTYGNTTRKHRVLDQEVLVLGRNPCCDVALVSPEVAPVHCIILRTEQGWRIRDCSGGRHATRVNGRVIHEEPLHDTDVLQIGTFSFEMRLPASRPTPVPGVTPVVDDRAVQRIKYLQRSRRNLVRLALNLRQRARRNHLVPPSLAELERQAESLRALQRDYEALVTEYESRLSELEKAEREVCDARDALESECTERQTRLEKAEHDMARRQAEADSLIKLRWEECQERCRQAEQAHARLAQVAAGRENSAQAVSDELALQLDRRSQELNHFARYLRRCRQRSAASPKQVPLVVAPSQLLQTDAQRAQREAEARQWQEQYGALQAEVAALDARSQQRQAELATERDKARAEADAAAARVQELQSISESLRREIQDRESVLEKLRRQLDQQSSPVNLEHSGSYERELNAYRLELEQNRRELNEQLYQLQARQAEVEVAAREAEVQMSRERAVIARERAELTRLRDEIRLAKDRSTREGGVRDRLATLHRLKQEMANSTSPSAAGDQRRQ
jgi:pSer/pThr/pTyr-binding forkhead associated (FHA) protein